MVMCHWCDQRYKNTWVYAYKSLFISLFICHKKPIYKYNCMFAKCWGKPSRDRLRRVRARKIWGSGECDNQDEPTLCYIHVAICWLHLLLTQSCSCGRGHYLTNLWIIQSALYFTRSFSRNQRRFQHSCVSPAACVVCNWFLINFRFWIHDWQWLLVKSYAGHN